MLFIWREKCWLNEGFSFRWVSGSCKARLCLHQCKMFSASASCVVKLLGFDSSLTHLDSFFSFFFSDDGQGEAANYCGWRCWRKNCHNCGMSVRGTGGGWLLHSNFASAALSLRVRGMAGVGGGTWFLDALFSGSAGGFGYFNFLLKTICTSAL